MDKPRLYDVIEVGDFGVLLNGKEAPLELQEVGMMVPLHQLISIPSQCPFCKKLLLIHSEDEVADSNDKPSFFETEDEQRKEYCLWYCRNCRFWQWYYVDGSYEYCFPSPEQKAYISKLRIANLIKPTNERKYDKIGGKKATVK